MTSRGRRRRTLGRRCSAFDDADCLPVGNQNANGEFWFTSMNRPRGRADMTSIKATLGPMVRSDRRRPSLELNTPGRETRLTLTGNGLTIYFTSTRAGGLGGIDIWTASRKTKNSPFCTPVNVDQTSTRLRMTALRRSRRTGWNCTSRAIALAAWGMTMCMGRNASAVHRISSVTCDSLARPSGAFTRHGAGFLGRVPMARRGNQSIDIHANSNILIIDLFPMEGCRRVALTFASP